MNPSHTARQWRLPLAVGTLIAASGLVFGGMAVSSAHESGHHATSPHGVSHRAANQHARSHVTNPTPAPNAPAPKHGDRIPNVTTVENQIKAYYGSVAGNVPGIGAVTLPSPSSNYAKELAGIEKHARAYLARAIHKSSAAKPAVVFDIDDTTLNTYDYEIFSQFAYNPTTNAQFVNAKAFPAVFGMPAMVNWAASKGYTVLFITGRPEAQRTATAANLADAGYGVATDTAHLFLKPATVPSYLHCAAVTTCTTIEYKSGTRAYLQSQGYKIIADFGDQFSDLKGGAAGRQFKLPNPMYYLP